MECNTSCLNILDFAALLIHLAISSSILSAFAGLRPHRQPLRELPLTVGFSIFSKHLFSDRLCRIEFYRSNYSKLINSDNMMVGMYDLGSDKKQANARQCMSEEPSKQPIHSLLVTAETKD
jgi:hypothetical protein